MCHYGMETEKPVNGLLIDQIRTIINLKSAYHGNLL